MTALYLLIYGKGALNWVPLRREWLLWFLCFWLFVIFMINICNWYAFEVKMKILVSKFKFQMNNFEQTLLEYFQFLSLYTSTLENFSY